MTQGHGREGYSRSRIRQALLHFLLGKAFAGLSNFFVLVLLVRNLEAAEYGVYVALLAFMAVALSVSSLGIEPTVERFLPEIKMNHSRVVTPFVLAGLLARSVVLAIACGAILVAMPRMADTLGLGTWSNSTGIFVVVIFMTGIMNSLITVLDALLLQRFSQLTSAAYALFRLAGVLILIYAARASVTGAVLMEMVATTAGVVSGAYFLRISGIRIASRGWGIEMREHLAPFRARMLRFGSFNYIAQFLMQGYSVETFRLLVTRFLGLAETARYGLAGSIMDLINRYLPAFLLVRLIRPIFVSRYAEHRDFSQINTFANVIFKMNMFFIAPLIACAVLIGDEAISILSAGRFQGDGYVLTASMLMLIPMSHQWVVSVTANTVERNDLQAKGAVLALLGLPIGIVAMDSVGLWGAFAGSYVSASLYNTFAIWFLRRHGFHYRQDALGLGKILFAATLAGVIVWLLHLPVRGLPSVILVSALVGGGYLVLSFALKPFRTAEREMINSVLPRKLFVF